MTDQEILDLTRLQLEDTVGPPYLWETSELLFYRNTVVDEVCRRVKQIRDSSTTSICAIDLLAGLATYTTSQKIVEITSARLYEEETDLSLYDTGYMDCNYSNWRNSEGTPTILIPEYEQNKLRVYPYYDDYYSVTGSSNITFTAATKTISKASGLSIFVAGDEINSTGTTNNNATVTAVTVSDTAIVVSETLVNENNTSAVLRRVEDTLNLSVIRLPLTWVTIANLTGSPPYDDQYHIFLALDGIPKHAYAKRDAETYNPKKVLGHTVAFEKSILDMIKARIVRTQYNQAVGPHGGTI